MQVLRELGSTCFRQFCGHSAESQTFSFRGSWAGSRIFKEPKGEQKLSWCCEASQNPGGLLSLAFCPLHSRYASPRAEWEAMCSCLTSPGTSRPVSTAGGVRVRGNRAVGTDCVAASPPFLSWYTDSFPAATNLFRKTSDSNCVAPPPPWSSSPCHPPGTPGSLKKPEPPQQGPGSTSLPVKEDPLMLDMVRSFGVRGSRRPDRTTLPVPSL